MSLFENGHWFNLAIRCQPPQGQRLPVVQVEMAGASGPFAPVVGKIDTGASRTMLDFATAGTLGISNPKSSFLSSGTAHTATGEEVTYYVHDVLVQIADSAGQHILFPLRAAFAKKVQRNLFGVDWLAHFCLAVDIQAVHFLMD